MDPNQPPVSSPAALPGDDSGKTKFELLKEKVTHYVNYDRLYIPEAVFAGIHLLAMLVLMLQYLMLLTFIGIRVPRVGLWFWARKTGDPKFQHYEWLFRKWSCFLYFPIAVIVQALTMVTNFCRVSGEPEECRNGYFWTMFILLILYMPFEFVMFFVVKKVHEEREANPTAASEKYRVGKPEKKDIEMKPHDMN